MPVRLAFVHTVPSLVPVFDALAAELLPAVGTASVVDETLLADAIRDGRVTDGTRERLALRVAEVASPGVEAVVVTCSSMGSAVDAIGPAVPVRLLRVDEAMADRAVSLGPRIAVLATLRSTLEPTSALVARRAETAGRAVDVDAVLCEGAFEALRAGDAAGHDRRVRDALEATFARADVVVLAQASMARVLEDLDVPIPVLSSPRLGMERVAELFGAAPRPAA
jgi:aspartate/glutamate racemase